MGTLRRIAFLALACLAAPATMCLAQTSTQPIDLQPGLVVDTPPNWVRGDTPLVDKAFGSVMGRDVVDSIHPTGSRMTDLPYGVVDSVRIVVPVTPAQQDEFAATLAQAYETAVNPPSKADRPTSWKRAKVSGIRHDYVNGRFEFDATITYDFVGDLHVRVAGVFGSRDFATLTLWNDAAYEAQHAAELTAMQRSVRFAGVVAAPRSLKEAFLTKARWFVGFVLVGVVGLQIWVLVRDRRERRTIS